MGAGHGWLQPSDSARSDFPSRLLGAHRICLWPLFPATEKSTNDRRRFARVAGDLRVHADTLAAPHQNRLEEVHELEGHTKSAAGVVRFRTFEDIATILQAGELDLRNLRQNLDNGVRHQFQRHSPVSTGIRFVFAVAADIEGAIETFHSTLWPVIASPDTCLGGG